MYRRMTFLLLLFFCGVPIWAVAGEDGAAERAAALAKAKQRLTAPQYDLQYRFHPGETIRWKVVHLVTVHTKIKGTTQTAKTRSISTKVWRVTSVDAEGTATLVYLVDEVNMWQQVTGRDEVKYDSTKDETPPAEYETIANTIGVPLTTITLKPNGQTIKRIDRRDQVNLGHGQITIPFPETPVRVGSSWSYPYDLPVRLKNGQVRKLKTRQRFQLTSVNDGIARIDVNTELLTPVDDPQVRVQVVQRMMRGVVKFDIDAGRVVEQQMDLDETVLAFNGADSSMNYLSRFTEEILTQEQEPEKAGSDQPDPPAADKSGDSTVDTARSPVLRKPDLRR